MLRRNHLLVLPTNPDSRCTTISVAAHAFYERPDPALELNPGGALDLSGAKCEQYDDRTVKVSGSRWIPMPYTVKVEGAKKVGFRTICVLGIRDERMIRQRQLVYGTSKEARGGSPFTLEPYKRRQKSAVQGLRQKWCSWRSGARKQIRSHELGLIVEVIAPREELSENVCELAGRKMLHMDYPGRIATAGNIAHPYSPTANNLGPVYAWNIWHLLELDDPCEPFVTKVRQFG